MTREYNPTHDAIEPIGFDDVIDRIHTVAMEHHDRYPEYVKKGWKIQLERTSYRSPYQNTDPEIIDSNEEMSLFDSVYRFRIGDKVRNAKYPKLRLAYFSINQLYSCCAACVLSGAYVHPQLRGRGLGAFLHKWKLYLLESIAGYSIAICTAVTDDDWNKREGSEYNAEETLLNHNNWNLVQHITNPKSHNDVGLFVRRLNPERYRA